LSSIYQVDLNTILLQSAPEKTQKDTLKSTIVPEKVQATTSNGIDHSSTENVIRETTELTNGYNSTNDHVDAIPESHRERSRQRNKKDDGKNNAEFLNQIATTMQHLQRDLDRITARVRSLEGKALQALAPQTVHNIILSKIMSLISIKIKYILLK